LAGALLFDEKICQSAALIWFGLRDDGVLQILYLRAILQRTIVAFPHIFGDWFGGKDCGLYICICICIFVCSGSEL
jgi:hypothetical protein